MLHNSINVFKPKLFFFFIILRPWRTIALFRPTKGTTSQTVPNETKSNIFISSSVKESEYTYVFNEFNNIFYESIGLDQLHYENVEFSDTHLLATSGPKELLINRVSGTMYITNGEIKEKGSCKLLDKTKF